MGKERMAIFIQPGANNSVNGRAVPCSVNKSVLLSGEYVDLHI